MIVERVEADVLCVGGGIAGLMAAISAAESGARVVVAEKANTVHSGGGAVGNDHFACYIPEVHGSDVMAMIKEWGQGQWSGRIRELEKVKTWFEKTTDIVKLWESWGIPMKYEGKYDFSGHIFPGQVHRPQLRYSGQMQKPVLTKRAREAGARIMNRVMIFELLGDNKRVTGALGTDARAEKLIEFCAPAVILGTGAQSRLYPPSTPGCPYNTSRGGSATAGDGRAIAYRLGAELTNMETLGNHAGPKYFVRAGQGTWTGVVRDPEGKPAGPFLTHPDKNYSDMIIEVKKDLFSESMASGKGPLVMDLRGISDADLEYMKYWMLQEGMGVLLNHLEEEGIDLRKNPIEFMTYSDSSRGNIVADIGAKTSVDGLYAAGDESPAGEGISAAAVFGWIAGENAASYSRKMLSSRENHDLVISEKVKMLETILSRADGPDWREAQVALNQVMQDYAGRVRSETILDAGLQHLLRLKKKTQETLVARNPHELVRGLEVLNLFDLGELVFIAAKARKESRGIVKRTDFAYTNPLLDKQLIIKRNGKSPITEWRS